MFCLCHLHFCLLYPSSATVAFKREKIPSIPHSDEYHKVRFIVLSLPGPSPSLGDRYIQRMAKNTMCKTYFFSADLSSKGRGNRVVDRASWQWPQGLRMQKTLSSVHLQNLEGNFFSFQVPGVKKTNWKRQCSQWQKTSGDVPCESRHTIWSMFLSLAFVESKTVSQLCNKINTVLPGTVWQLFSY